MNVRFNLIFFRKLFFMLEDGFLIILSFFRSIIEILKIMVVKRGVCFLLIVRIMREVSVGFRVFIRLLVNVNSELVVLSWLVLIIEGIIVEWVVLKNSE